MTIFASDEYPGAGTIASSVHKISTALLAIPSMAAGGRPNLSLRVDNLLDNNVAVIGWQRDGCTLTVNVESTVIGTLSDSASFVEDKVGHESKVELDVRGPSPTASTCIALNFFNFFCLSSLFIANHLLCGTANSLYWH